ncbi:hypothetical protein E2C01_098796 [Portunus trituberculatus]|uniref:Uncharacterized protein n=1 Tax=Portunus trituberculatus TaxID=210409 RepID=A0A5B7K248_PORTR|nr:hypothetical protein [Portunus trituberculatus]
MMGCVIISVIIWVDKNKVECACGWLIVEVGRGCSPLYLLLPVAFVREYRPGQIIGKCPETHTCAERSVRGRGRVGERGGVSGCVDVERLDDL